MADAVSARASLRWGALTGIPINSPGASHWEDSKGRFFLTIGLRDLARYLRGGSHDLFHLVEGDCHDLENFDVGHRGGVLDCARGAGPVTRPCYPPEQCPRTSARNRASLRPAAPNPGSIQPRSWRYRDERRR